MGEEPRGYLKRWDPVCIRRLSCSNTVSELYRVEGQQQ
uniref:Uncharacterized protein n=1 Tax=Anguilla anguilla TaxID=7936 RepID=A0A0E9RRI6_ANGAN